MGNMRRVMTRKKILIGKEIVMFFNSESLAFLVEVINGGSSVATRDGSKGRILSY